MKKIILLFPIFFMIAIFGCRNEDLLPTGPRDSFLSQQGVFKFEKELTIYDDSKMNSILLKISSNSKERFDDEISKSYKIVPIKQSNEELINLKNEFNNYSNRSNEEKKIISELSKEEEENNLSESIDIISIEVLKTNLQPNIKSYEIKSIDNSNRKRQASCTSNGFNNYTMTNYNQQYATIRSTNFRVYANLYSKDNIWDVFWDARDYASVCLSLCNGQKKTLYSSVSYKVKLDYSVSRCNIGTDWTVAWGRF